MIKEAMEWWNNLPMFTITTEVNKSALTKKYHGDLRVSLTGREIEKIYIKETSCNCEEKGKTVWQLTSNGKCMRCGKII